METNTIYEGDNLEILNKFSNESVDLIYADPPFFTNKGFEIIWKDKAEIMAFEDRWKGGVEHYVAWMEPRLRECHRILKKTGSMYLHCDTHAVAHLRILMDKIFGDSNFRNEIIWKRTNSPKAQTKGFGSQHDIILFYTKTNEFNFNKSFREHDQKSLGAYNLKDEKGEFQTVAIIAGGAQRYKGRKEFEFKGVKAPWLYSKENLEEFDKKGLIYKTKGGLYRLKKYIHETEGVLISDIWIDDEVKPLQGVSNEYLGYPTQKPVALLERIIKASSNKGDIVLDPFCGCGTTLVASQKLERKWIGIDISPTACKVMAKRIRKLFSINAHVVRGEVDLSYIRKLPPFEFQNWVIVDKFLGNVSKTKSGDFGIDGLTSQIMGGYPIQVKQSEGIGRNVIDNFETAIDRANKKKGYIIAFSFGKGAYEEVARIKNEKNINIILRTVQELLDGKVEE